VETVYIYAFQDAAAAAKLDAKEWNSRVELGASQSLQTKQTPPSNRTINSLFYAPPPSARRKPSEVLQSKPLFHHRFLVGCVADVAVGRRPFPVSAAPVFSLSSASLSRLFCVIGEVRTLTKVGERQAARCNVCLVPAAPVDEENNAESLLWVREISTLLGSAESLGFIVCKWRLLNLQTCGWDAALPLAHPKPAAAADGQAGQTLSIGRMVFFCCDVDG
jgi:hypothetical protein